MPDATAAPPIAPRPRPGDRAGAVLTIDLGAIRANHRLLRRVTAPAACAAVVKADAYGLGAAPVARALLAEGCRDLFVAHLEEGIALRAALGRAPRILVLHGPLPGTEAECAAHGLVPVLNDPCEIAAWAALCRARGERLPAWVQVDSGMARLGLAPAEVAALAEDEALDTFALAGVMSHLACADEPEHPANAAQLAVFEALRRRLPPAPASLAASSGVFLGPAYRFDLVRPGAAHYGINPTPGRPNPMRPVVRLQARVVQTREVPAGTPVGYGHTATTTAPTRLATIVAGYADGVHRAASGRGAAWFGGVRLPFLGRVSMDSIILDVTALPPGTLRPGTLVDLLDPEHGVDEAALAEGTIGYEVLTSLGARYHREYLDGGDMA
ncbi:alanine racemase [Roseomonas sp. OT10]|uniref:alanine racemase n=1 Tax=Roseomonas cutis TaxID=2897332 RepID=UPI001E3D9620|nr:alanine racemase [Roseomonas sp. OT10]UFN47101.1 alanine racemase [Roseomonas sp. OT10]